MRAKLDVTVVGSCIADLCISIPRAPQIGETVVGTAVSSCLGGKGANQAIALARLGAKVGIVGRVGADVFGEQFRKLFEREGVSLVGLTEDSSRPTGVGVPLVFPDGKNMIVVAPSAALHLSSRDVSRSAGQLRSSRALLVQLEGPRKPLLAAMDMGRRAGVPVFLNPAPVMPFARDAVTRADVVVPNEAEAEHLLGRRLRSLPDVIVAARNLRSLGPAVVIVTLGREGAVIACDDYTGHVEGFAVDAVDTTGAGDAFCAGLVWSRLNGRGWKDAVEYANVCGAIACCRVGSGPAMPAAREVRAFVKARQANDSRAVRKRVE